MVAIGNPIRGPLHEYGWKRPAGNTEMVVTQTAAQHMSSAVHVAGPPALDIGDGNPDLDEILCPHAGVVSQAFSVGSANLSIDWIARDGKKWRVVLAHNTLPHPVVVGQALVEGQVVGRMGMTGATAIHLHIQLGWWNGTAWVWVDPWPYLRQNGATEEDEMLPIPGANYKRIANKKASLKLGGNFRDERKGGAVLDSFPAGTVIYPVAYANDGDVPSGSQSGEWWACFLYVKDRGVMLGWFHSSVVGPLEDDVAAGGIPQAKYDADVAAAKLAGRAAGIQAAKDDLADLK